MADESPAGARTEEPTPRRLREARNRGEVARSRKLSGALGLGALLGVLMLAGPGLVGRQVAYLSHALGLATRGGGAGSGLALALRQATALAAWPLAVAVLAALVAGAAQTGGLITLQALRFDPARALPSRRRVLRAAAFGELVEGCVEVLAVGAIAWLTLLSFARPVAALAGASAALVLAAFGRLGGSLAVRLTAALVVLGALDYAWQRRRHRAGLRMTRAEVRRERRESEGDPRHKAERQRLHRELAEQRMLAEIRKADFVVVNPDHLAVAMRYDRDGDGAPVVVAKGERLLAQRIKEVAREAGVPIFRDVTLARSLGALEEGDEIPEALYEAVAEILRVVYAHEPAPAREDDAPAGADPGWRRA